MKILFAFSDWAYNKERKKRNTYGGVGYYRIIKPAENCPTEYKVVGKELKLYGDSLESQWDNIFKEFDVFWCSYFTDGELAAAIFYHAQKYGKKVVVDCDDNYLDVPTSNPLYDIFKSGKKDRAFTSTILSLADVITVSTKPLKERLWSHIKAVHSIEKEIVVIPNMSDLRDWNYPVAERDELVIGYVGSNSHQDDLKMVIPSLSKVLEKHKHVKLEIIGAIEQKHIKDYFDDVPQEVRNRIAILPATATFKEFPLWLASQGWSIGIAPLVDTAFTRSKSHIKWLEYSALKIPTVASRVYPYFMDLEGRKTITHGETGMLAKENEWEQVLDELIVNEKKRKQVGENAYNHVKDVWQYDKSVITPVLNALYLQPHSEI